MSYTSMSQEELELTRQALEKERQPSPGLTITAERGPRGEQGGQPGEVSRGLGWCRWPRRRLLARGSPNPPPLRTGSLDPRPVRPGSLNPLSAPLPKRLSSRAGSSPQVSRAEPELEHSPGGEEKERWRERLEHLQQAVARLEIDRGRLQRHNLQLRSTLEQVSSSCCPQLLLHSPASTLLLLQHPE